MATISFCAFSIIKLVIISKKVDWKKNLENQKRSFIWLKLQRKENHTPKASSWGRRAQGYIIPTSAHSSTDETLKVSKVNLSSCWQLDREESNDIKFLWWKLDWPRIALVEGKYMWCLYARFGSELFDDPIKTRRLWGR